MNEALHVLRLAGIRHILDGPSCTLEPALARLGRKDPPGNGRVQYPPREELPLDVQDMAGAQILDTPPWPAILAKAPPAARCVFTYADLGQDLAGTPSRERGQLWRRLIGLLGFPPGSVAFLPYSLPGEVDPRLAQSAFTHALRRIAPATVLAFTSSDEELLASLVVSTELGGCQSVRLFTAPDPQVLLASSDESLVSRVPPAAQLLRSGE